MVLAQDAAQASEAQHILDVQQYRKDKAQYDKDLAKYEADKAAQEAKVAAAKKAEDEAKAKKAKEDAERFASYDRTVTSLQSQKASYQSQLAALPQANVRGLKSTSNFRYWEQSPAYARAKSQYDKAVRSLYTISKMRKSSRGYQYQRKKYPSIAALEAQKASASAAIQNMENQVRLYNQRRTLSHRITETDKKIQQTQSQKAGAIKQYQAKQQAEARARSAVLAATSDVAYRTALFKHRNTDYVKSTYGRVPTPTRDKMRRVSKSGKVTYIGSGGAGNRANAVDEIVFVHGGSYQQVAQQIAMDYKRGKAIRNKQSAGLRAQGNAQIKAAQVKELQRLGGSGALTSGAHGPTSVSAYVSAGGTRAAVAAGTPTLAQLWPTGATILTKDQGYIASKDRVGFTARATVAAKETLATIKEPNAPKPIGTPQQNFADIATPGTSLKQREQRYSVTTGDDTRTFKNKETAEKFIARTTPVVDGSYIGFSKDGKPIQGPPKPIEQKIDKNDPRNFLQVKQEPTKYSTDPTTHGFLSELDKITRASEKTTQLLDKRQGEGISTFVSAGTTAVLGVATSTANILTKGAGFVSEKLGGPPDPVTKDLYVPKSAPSEGISGSLEGVVNVDNLDDPSTIIQPDKFSLERGYKRAEEQSMGQSYSATLAQWGVEIVPVALTGGAGAIKSGLGISARSVILPVATKVGKGAVSNLGKKGITQTMVPVAKEYTLFNKPILTKTYQAPTQFELKPTITQRITKANIGTAEQVKKDQKIRKAIAKQQKIVDAKDTSLAQKQLAQKEIDKLSKGIPDKPLKEGKLVLADKTTTTKIGSVQPTQVLQRSTFTPTGRGFEIQTGAKYQTSFNREIVKLTTDDSKHVDEIIKARKLALTVPSKKYEQIEGDIVIGRLTKEQNIGLVSAIKTLQSPLNWTKGQRRVGQVGGSYSEIPQLRPKYQKTDIHDLDIDVPSESMAVRAAKTVSEKVPSTDEVGVELSKGRGTKVESVIKGERDEFVEFLGPKDALKGDTQAISTGLRFGDKYRSDTIVGSLKPVKDQHGITVRHVHDQITAKSSSILSVQGKATEKFKNPTTKDVWELKQNKLIDEGKLHVAPFAGRGKDIVGDYRLFKSAADTLKESKLSFRRKRGEELNQLAENLRARNPELDYNKQLAGKATVEQTPSSVSLLSKSISSKSTPLTGFTPQARVIPNQQTSSLNTVDESRSSASLSVSPKIQPRDASKFARQAESSVSFNTPSSRTVQPSSVSKPSTSISKSKSVSTSSKSLFSSSPRSFASTRPSRASLSVKSPSRKASPSVKSPSVGSPKSPSVPGSPKVPSIKVPKAPSVRAPPVPKTRKATSNVTKTRKRARVILPLPKNTEVFNKAKKQKHVDFLGNTKTDKIEGLFRRKELLRGDKKTDRQVVRDKKKGFKKLSVRIF